MEGVPAFSESSAAASVAMTDEDEDGDDQLGPTHVNTTKASHLVKVHKDKLTVTYMGKANHAQDVGAVLANRPFAKKVLIGYFEMTVIHAGSRGCMAIGLGNSSFNVMRHPGWEPGSYGYHGDDGRKFLESGRGEPYGPKFSTQDTVGCGLHFGTREIFFTKNGKHLGVAFTHPAHSYYPIVGLHSEGERVELNFGQKPFAFRLGDMIREEREKLQLTISRVPMDTTLVNGIVRNYLEHYACHKTLEAFPPLEPSEPQPMLSSLETRKEIRELLMAGKLTEASAKIEGAFPGLLAKSTRARAYLRCQEFIEHVRDGRRDAALETAQEHMAPLLMPQDPARGPARQDGAANGSQNGHSTGALGAAEEKEVKDLVQRVLGLLAYSDVQDSALEDIFDTSHRQIVADIVNGCILRMEGHEEMSSLEKLLKHLLVSHDTLRQLQGGRGEVLELSEMIQKS